jgi:ATP-binding cassette subfamily C protein
VNEALRYTVAELRTRPGVLLALAGWSVAEALPSLVSGYATARAVDDGFLAGRPGTGFAWLGLYAGAAVVGAAGARGGYRCLGRLVEPFRDGLVRHVVAAELSRATTPGARPDTAAVSRLTHQVEIVRDTLAGLLTTVRGFLFTTVAALVGLLSLAPALAGLVAVPLLLGLAVFGAGLPATAARQRRYVRTDERLAEATGAVLGAHRDVVACGAQDWAARLVPVTEQARAEAAVARMAALRTVSLSVGGWLPLVVVLATAPWLVRHGIAAGAVLGALMYVLQGLQPALHTLVHGLAGGGLRFTVTLNRLLSIRPQETVHSGVSTLGAGLSMRGVTFRYGPHADPVVEDFDLDVPDGDHLAIVGASGIGKSTLASLMAGLLSPQSGTVRLAGDRVLIPQEAYVFTGTVEENLTYLGRSGPVEEAVERLGAGPLVARLGGYRARLDPTRLSAGERQLVALVRAYLSPARLVILDEASCHLHPAAEAVAEEAFAARAGSLVVIAHRISSARRARRILLLDGPRTALGTHETLLATALGYRDLVAVA